MDSTQRVRVLSNPGVWRDGDNPFLKLLFDSYGPTVDLVPFTWRRALGFDYDVVHVHWLEYLVRSETKPKRAMKQALFALLLLRLVIFRTSSIWTVHNDEPHDRSGSRVERALLAIWTRTVTHRVFLTRAARMAANSPERSSVILHGHYRPDLVHPAPSRPAAPAREILHFGHLRPYKGIESLVAAYTAAWPDPLTRPRLRILGRPKDKEYGEQLVKLVSGVPGIELRQDFLPDSELEAAIGQSDLVVLPYTKMYNSGAALLALSVGRPILVPASPTMLELREEVGAAWVALFAPPFAPDDLRKAFSSDEIGPRGAFPDLSARDWPVIGAAYRDLFRRLAQRK